MLFEVIISNNGFIVTKSASENQRCAPARFGPTLKDDRRATLHTVSVTNVKIWAAIILVRNLFSSYS
jgi:hypothetical protein